MYEAAFGFERRPFSATPDAQCCYLSEELSELYAELLRHLEDGQGISLLMGAAGTGKTLLCQVLLGDLRQNYQPLCLSSGQLESRGALLQAILFELGQPYSGMCDQELRLELLATLRTFHQQGRPGVLIVDEAHLLGDKLLEEIRLLADWNADGQPLLRILLSAQPALEDLLTQPALTAFNQRVTSHMELEPLTFDESLAYLEYRLQWAGGQPSRLLTTDALQMMARAADGLPRALNQLGDHVLLLAFVADLLPVTPEIVQEALGDLQHLPLHWNMSAIPSPRKLFEPTSEEEVDTLEPFTAEASFEFGADMPPQSSSTTPHMDADEFPFDMPDEADVFEVQDAADSDLPAPKILPRPQDHTMRATGFSRRTPTVPQIQITGRHASWLAQDLPAVEGVVDPFAATAAAAEPIAAVPTQPVRPARVAPPVKATPAPAKREATLPPAAEKLAVELGRHRPERALELIDALLPALEEEIGPVNGPGIAELITPRGVERVAPAIPSRHSPSPSQEDLLGAEVMELGIEIERVSEQPARPRQAPSEAHRQQVREILGDIDRLTRLDIVQPEPAPTSSSGANYGTHIPRPKFQNLFSQLRRRQLSRDE